MAAIAARTERVITGPLVTPLARRRPHQLARETVTLDRLSGGRLVLGVGRGQRPQRRVRPGALRRGGRHEGAREAARRRAREAAGLLGGRVRAAAGATARSRSGSRRAGRSSAGRSSAPARHDGVFPIDQESPEALAELIAAVGPGKDIVVTNPRRHRPRPVGGGRCDVVSDGLRRAADLRRGRARDRRASSAGPRACRGLVVRVVASRPARRSRSTARGASTGSSRSRPKRPSAAPRARGRGGSRPARRRGGGRRAASSRARSGAAPAAPMTSVVQLFMATMPRMSSPSESAISAPTTNATPTMNAIDFAPQWIGEPSSSSRPAAANTTHVQPLPSMPRNVVPVTVPLGSVEVEAAAGEDEAQHAERE